MVNPQLSDEELVIGCRKGERSVQAALFTRFSSRMFGVCRRFTASRMDAEDQLHEGFLIVFREIGRFRGGSLEGWIRRIMVNQCLAFFRRQQRDRLWLQEVTEEMEEEIGSGVEAWSDFLEAGQLMALIDRLPLGAKTVFQLSAVEGYSHAEIAQLLHISESASRSQLTRARQALQMHYQNPLKTEST